MHLPERDAKMHVSAIEFPKQRFVMPLHFDYYKMFYYVGKTGSFTQAAESMFLSQSTLSRGIQSLEAELGCELMERTRSGIVLTEAGRELYSHVASACESIFRGEERLARMKRDNRNVLRIGASDLSFAFFVLPTIRRFSDQYPEVRLSIVSSGYHYADEVCRSLISGKTDLACTAAASFGPDPDELVRIDRIASYSDMLITGPYYPELRGRIFRLSELKDYPYAVPAIETSGPSETERLFLKQGITLVPKVRVDSILILPDILRACRCIAVVPSIMKERMIHETGLFEIRTDETLPSHDVCIVTAENSENLPLRNAFIGELEKTIRDVL